MPNKNINRPVPRPKIRIAPRVVARPKQLLPMAEPAAIAGEHAEDNHSDAPGSPATDPQDKKPGGASTSSSIFGRKESTEAHQSKMDRTVEIRRQSEAQRERQNLSNKKWVSVGLPLDKGMREIKVKGPIRILGHSPVVGFDQVRYTVDWHPLDKEGNVLPVFRRDQPLEEQSAAAGLITEQFREPRIFEPPFEWPHGFRVTISVPPQAQTRRGSPGVELRISVPEGGLLQK